jgi:hypothetical protein
MEEHPYPYVSTGEGIPIVEREYTQRMMKKN